MIEVKEIQREIMQLPTGERLRLAHWLLSTVVEGSLTVQDSDGGDRPNRLLSIAGRFSGGPGDTAERAEEILEQEVRAQNGLSHQ